MYLYGWRAPCRFPSILSHYLRAPIVGCSIHLELVTTYMYMDEEHRADIHPFLVIICAHQLLVAQHTLSWLKLTCIHMDEEHRADIHPIFGHFFARNICSLLNTPWSGYICHSVHRRPRLLHHLLQASAATSSRHTHCKTKILQHFMEKNKPLHLDIYRKQHLLQAGHFIKTCTKQKF